MIDFQSRPRPLVQPVSASEPYHLATIERPLIKRAKTAECGLETKRELSLWSPKRARCAPVSQRRRHALRDRVMLNKPQPATSAASKMWGIAPFSGRMEPGVGRIDISSQVDLRREKTRIAKTLRKPIGLRTRN